MSVYKVRTADCPSVAIDDVVWMGGQFGKLLTGGRKTAFLPPPLRRARSTEDDGLLVTAAEDMAEDAEGAEGAALAGGVEVSAPWVERWKTGPARGGQRGRNS